MLLSHDAVAWLNNVQGVALDTSALDTTSCPEPVRLSTANLSVCLASSASSEVLSADVLSSNAPASSSSSSDIDDAMIRKSTRSMSSEQAAENRHAMVMTASIAAAALVAIVAGLVIAYRSSGGSSERSEPKPAAAAAHINAAVSAHPSRKASAPGDLTADLLEWTIESRELALEDEIAWGRTCAVYTAIYRGERVIVKKLLTHVTRANEATFRRELQLLTRFQHAKVVRFFGVAWTQRPQKLQLVLEYMAFGDLQTYLSSVFIDPVFAHEYVCDRWGPRGAALQIALDVTEGLAYAHTVDAVEFGQRRVLTSRQILLDDRVRAKLSDFGGQQQLDNTTARWLAPEVLAGEASYNEAADVYALGVVLWELDTCDLPFAQHLPERDFGLSRVEVSDELEGVWQRVAKGELTLAPRADCPPLVRQLVLQCLASEPFARPSAADVLQQLRDVVTMSDKRSDAASECSATTVVVHSLPSDPALHSSVARSSSSASIPLRSPSEGGEWL